MVSIMKLGRLTDGIFETGAYGVSSKSQNPTVCEMEGSCWCQMDGANGMPS